jgi:hypothetical protein
LISSSYGGTAVEWWSSPDALKKCNSGANSGASSSSSYSNTPQNPLAVGVSNSQLWNAMIVPLLRVSITGVIWSLHLSAAIQQSQPRGTYESHLIGIKARQMLVPTPIGVPSLQWLMIGVPNGINVSVVVRQSMSPFVAGERLSDAAWGWALCGRYSATNKSSISVWICSVVNMEWQRR